MKFVIYSHFVGVGGGFLEYLKKTKQHFWKNPTKILFESCPGLLLLSFTVSVALVEYLCRTPDFDSLDTALPDGILRFERLVGRQMPNHFRSLAGQEAHLRQLRATFIPSLVLGSAVSIWIACLENWDQNFIKLFTGISLKGLGNSRFQSTMFWASCAQSVLSKCNSQFLVWFLIRMSLT